jgi:hypothetical protein
MATKEITEAARRRRDTRSPIVGRLPTTASVEEEIRELSGRVRVLLELLNVCRLADNGGRERKRSQEDRQQKDR